MFRLSRFGGFKMEEQIIECHDITPIYRIFDIAKAQEFYIHFLDFQLDWEHQYEDHFPIYMQVSRGNCVIHLSEHHGDCSPGSAIRVKVNNIEALHSTLKTKSYKYNKPGLEKTPRNTKEITVIDPFSNKITFFESL